MRRTNSPAGDGPAMAAQNTRYGMANRAREVDCGGIGAFHVLARTTALMRAIDARVKVLRQHKPYHESDHVLNIAYNALTGGTRFDDIELRRNDPAYLDALGAEHDPVHAITSPVEQIRAVLRELVPRGRDLLRYGLDRGIRYLRTAGMSTARLRRAAFSERSLGKSVRH